MPDPHIQRAVGRIMVHSPGGPADNPAKLAAARRELAEVKIEQAIRRELSRSGPLGADQTSRLSDLLRSGGLL